jgi:cysteinyl-tRNA synthetase
MGSEKMSKSLGNLVTLGDALSWFGADAIRLFILSSHYRSPLTYSEEGLAAAQKGVDRLVAALRIVAQGGGQREGEELDSDRYRELFIEAMDDDFNTAHAVRVLFSLARDINRARERGTRVGQGQETLRELAGVLGFVLKEEEPPLSPGPFTELVMEVHNKLSSDAPHLEAAVAPTAGPLVDYLIEVRKHLRDDKQWADADWLRARLEDLGVVLEDKPEGTAWKAKRWVS